MSSENHIEVTNELKKLSSLVASLPKEPVGNVPDDYFDKVESDIISQLYVSENLENEPKEVPAGYFDQVEDSILRKLNNDTTKTITLNAESKHKMTWWYGVAASLVFIIAAIFIVQSGTNDDNQDFLSYEFEEAQWDYLLQNIDDIDLELLIDYDLVEESDFSVITFNQ